MYKLSDIRYIHLEMTEKCSLKCPMCARTDNPYIDGSRELDFYTVRKSIVPILNQLEKVYVCGNFGEPAMANDTLRILKYLRKTKPNIQLSINTNGVPQRRKWWEELAKIVDYARFGIDGLSDTHNIYRVGSSWNKIMRNCLTFIDNGGKAWWDFLIFRHNEDQVEQARMLAKYLGFEKFIAKKTSRFFSSKELSIRSEVSNIQPPTDPDHINKFCQKYDQKKLLNAPIKCKVKEEKNIFITAEGYVLPCCWLAGMMYKTIDEHRKSIWNLIETYGKENINIKNKSLEEIFETGIFEDIVESWNGKKLFECIKTCSNGFDFFGGQFK